MWLFPQILQDAAFAAQVHAIVTLLCCGKSVLGRVRWHVVLLGTRPMTLP